MKEIGGYLDFENFKGKEYYENALAFNCSRNALRYIIKKRNIKTLYLPIYLCEVIYNACKKENLKIKFYHINEKFLPLIEDHNFNRNTYVYIVNFYGLLNNNILKKLEKKYNNVIVDNTHSFFQKPINNIDTIYNCRKYFGVPDGAYLCTNLKADSKYEIDKSANRFEHLIGRYENSASEFYQKYLENDKKFDNMDIKYMSNITKNILRAIDYKEILKKRKENFNHLKSGLDAINELSINSNKLTFMYPLLLKDGEYLRKELIKKKVYVPTLWLNTSNDFELSEIEKKYINNIIPLPIDQRYNEEDMKYICDIMGKEFRGIL